MNYLVSIDPSRRGNTRIKRIFWVVSILLLSLIFIATLTHTQVYQNIIGPYQPNTPLTPSIQVNSPMPHPTPIATGNIPPERKKIYAFGVEWDNTTRVSLIENHGHLDALIMEELTLTSSGMELINPEKFKRTQAYLAPYAPHTSLYVLINNYNQLTHLWDRDILYSILSNKVKRRNLELRLRAFSLQHNLAGINIDFEELDQKTYPYYVLFIKELSGMLHSIGKTLSVDIPLSHNLFNLSEIIPYVDLIFLMAYDEHWSTSASGPIASRSWFDQNIRSAVNTIPREKLVVTLGNYGYDWIIGEKKATSLTVKEVRSLIEETGATVILDPTTSNPMFYYRDVSGKDHVVWYLDALTVNQQLPTLESLGIKNISVWRMGSEDPKIGSIIERFARGTK